MGILDLVIPHLEMGINGTQDIRAHHDDPENDDRGNKGVFDQALAALVFPHVKSIYYMWNRGKYDIFW